VKKTRARHDPKLDVVKNAAGSEERTQVNVYLPKKLQRELKFQAAMEDRSMSSIVEEAIDLYINQKRSEP
jgi:predicted HicB family RNase H-like nuclease